MQYWKQSSLSKLTLYLSQDENMIAYVFDVLCIICLAKFCDMNIPDCKVHWANMGPTWVLSAPYGPHVGPMNLAIRDVFIFDIEESQFQGKLGSICVLRIEQMVHVMVVGLDKAII